MSFKVQKRLNGFLLLIRMIQSYNMKKIWNLPAASTNIIFGIIARKIIVLVGFLVYILIEKSLLNYGAFVNLYLLYHMEKLQMKEVLLWTRKIYNKSHWLVKEWCLIIWKCNMLLAFMNTPYQIHLYLNVKVGVSNMFNF